jgi:hypothetical protein
LLAKLPAATVPMPSLDGLAVSRHDTTTSGNDPTSSADAGITALHLALPSLTLHAVSDPVQSTLASSLAQLNTLLPTLGLTDATTALSGTLNDLQGVAAALPTGSALDGLRTIGLDVSLAGIGTSVQHNRALAAGSGGPTAPGTTTPGTTTPGTTTPGTTTPGTTTPDTTVPDTTTPDTTVPDTTTPDTTTPDTPGTTTDSPDKTPTSMPFSGTNSAAEVGLALVVLLVGAHLSAAGRRRRTSDG